MAVYQSLGKNWLGVSQRIDILSRKIPLAKKTRQEKIIKTTDTSAHLLAGIIFLILPVKIATAHFYYRV